MNPSIESSLPQSSEGAMRMRRNKISLNSYKSSTVEGNDSLSKIKKVLRMNKQNL